MEFNKLRIFSGKPKPLSEPSVEERAFMDQRWYHGSPKADLQLLLPGGRKFFTLEDGVHVSLTKSLPRNYGENISEWKLKGPLKIVRSEELGPKFSKQKNTLRETGYVGYYWIDREGIGSGVVWDGRDLEKIGETKED